MDSLKHLADASLEKKPGLPLSPESPPTAWGQPCACSGGPQVLQTQDWLLEGACSPWPMAPSSAFKARSLASLCPCRAPSLGVCSSRLHGLQSYGCSEALVRQSQLSPTPRSLALAHSGQPGTGSRCCRGHPRWKVGTLQRPRAAVCLGHVICVLPRAGG
ncbi:testis-expressed protein 22 isoform X2 [Suricata suricatta]|uniref:testis-expressed protein 22 isoform X2 n=1 Tax=Suricata suricatta TaxID=37032 RepID=UPI001155BA8C|nr:testis-expressed protein 22 isoform X2 [Suricata suricatta]